MARFLTITAHGACAGSTAQRPLIAVHAYALSLPASLEASAVLWLAGRRGRCGRFVALEQRSDRSSDAD